MKNNILTMLGIVLISTTINMVAVMTKRSMETFKYYDHVGQSTPFVKRVFWDRRLYVLEKNLGDEREAIKIADLFFDNWVVAIKKFQTIYREEGNIIIYSWQSNELGEGYFAMDEAMVDALKERYKSNKSRLDKLQ